MEDSSNCDIGGDGESVAMIPNQKTLNIDLPSSSDDDDVSSMVSMKGGCESPLSSWDSEPENDILLEESLHDINLEGNFLDMEEQNHFVAVENIDDGFSWEVDNRSYDELLKKFIEKEEELRVSNLKLQLSEQEIIKLAVQVENSEMQINDVCEKLELKEIQVFKSENQLDNLRGELNLKNDQLDNMRKELELKEEELNEQKKLSEEEIFKLKNQIKESENQLDNVRDELNLKKEELQKQTAKLNTHVPRSVNIITNLTEQLEAARKKVNFSTVEIAILRKELDNKSSMTHQLQCQIKEEKKNRAILENLVTMNENIDHKEELTKLNSTLLELQVKFFCEKKKMDAEIASLSKQKNQLTSALEDCESRNKELEQKVVRNETDEIRYLRKRLCERMNVVEAANKKSEKVMIEIDEANVKIDKLKAVICSRDDEISLLETEVRKQNSVISDMAEEKKEVIRELCNSIEHYRSGYNEAIQALNASRRAHCYSFLV